MLKLKVIQRTHFKPGVGQATEYAPEELVLIEKGREFDVHSYADADKGHLKVAFLDTKLGPKEKNTWHVFAKHVEIDGNLPDNNPNDADSPVLVGPAIALPGKGPVALNEPIISDGNFTWAEATKGGIRIPASTSVVNNVIAIAKVMQEVRARLGNRPIHITSWYRPPAVNAAVGGASASRHIVGDGVDFYVEGMTPHQVYNNLESWHGFRGGLARGAGFVHIDHRGYRARWNYPGA